MQEKLISFETAKLAKEKGFWLSSINWRESMTFYNINKDGNHYLIESALGNDCDKSYQCYAPTQSLLQKWLREEYNIDVCVYPVEMIKGDRAVEQEEYEYTYWIFIKGRKELPLSSQVHDTFENTLEHALKRGLEVIK